MTFKSAAWNGGSESLVVNLSVEGGGAISQSSITNKKGEWTEYTVTLTGLTEESKVKFEAANASNNRFFLDEVLIEKASTYSRTVNANALGTICLPFTAIGMEGATFYDVVGIYKKNGALSSLHMEPVTKLEAGKPYVFESTETSINIIGDKSNSSVRNTSYMVGNLSETPMDVPGSAYLILLADNKLHNVGADGIAKIAQYKAYFTLDINEAEEEPEVQAPGRRVIQIVDNANVATSIDAIDATAPAKFYENGNVFIRVNGRVFNAQGQLVK